MVINLLNTYQELIYMIDNSTIKNNDTDWMNIFKKKEKINELNRL